MIILNHVHKRYRSRSGWHTVLDDVCFSIGSGEKLGVLGKNGAGKSTLVRIVSGQESPDRGSISRNLRVSWPLAFSGGFQGSLTGRDNLRFLCRIYGVDSQKAERFVLDFAELGKFYREPVKNYSNGMQARLAFALSLAIEFECYLIDEILAVGDQRFHARCVEELFNVRRDRAFLIVSHNAGFILNYCDKAVVLDQAKVSDPMKTADALRRYEELLNPPAVVM